MADAVTIKFNCPDCGGAIVWDDEAADYQLSRCSGCGQDGPSIGELKARGMAETKKLADKMLKDAFKGTGWKLS